MVSWSVIAMLKENLFLVLGFSALAVLAALKLNEKCCSTKKQEDLESNQEKSDEPVIVQAGSGLQEEEQVESKAEPPAGEERDQTDAEISTETHPRKEDLNEESKDEESRPEDEKTKRSQEDEIQTGLEMDLRNQKESTTQLEEGQEETTNAAREDEDLQPNVSMRSTMSGLCSCLASFCLSSLCQRFLLLLL